MRTGRRQDMWAVIRYLRSFEASEVTKATGAEHEAVNRFINDLAKAGVLEAVSVKKHGIKQWRLVNDLGPLKPTFGPDGAMSNPNPKKGAKKRSLEKVVEGRERKAKKELENPVEARLADGTPTQSIEFADFVNVVAREVERGLLDRLEDVLARAIEQGIRASREPKRRDN